MNNAKKILEDAVLVTVTGYLAQGINILRGFVVARLLDPAVYGYFSGLALIIQYNSQGHLGVLHGMNRELSLLKGRGDKASDEAVRSTGISFILLMASLIGTGLLSYSFLASEELGPAVSWGFRTYAILCILYHLEMILHSLLRVDYRFLEISISSIIFVAANLLLTIVLALAWGFYGILAALSVSLFLENIYLIWRARPHFRFLLRWVLLRRLLLTGFPISVASLCATIFRSIDRLIIIWFLTSKDLGYYGIAMTVSEIVSGISASFTYVLYPRVVEQFGVSAGDQRSLSRLYWGPSSLLSGLFAGLVGCLFLLTDALILFLLPEYAPSTVLVEIMLFSAFFLAMTQPAVAVMSAVLDMWILLSMQAGGMILTFCLSYLAVLKGYGVLGVAAATTVSAFFYANTVLLFVNRKFTLSIGKALFRNLTLCMPIIYTSLLLLLICKWIPQIDMPRAKPFEAFGSVSVNLLCFLALYFPLFYYFQRETSFLAVVRSFVQERFWKKRSPDERAFLDGYSAAVHNRR